jgi:RES domain/HEPN/RES N-terminal domain 1
MVADEDDSDNIYICHGCIGDPFLKKEVRRAGSRRRCHFCNKTRKAWPLNELAERVQGVIEEHFRVTPSDPYEEGLPYDRDMEWHRRGEPVANVIGDIASLDPEVAEAVRDSISEKTSWDAHDGGYNDPFGSDAYYEEGRPDTYGFHENWQFFRKEVKTRSRFFGRSAQRTLDEIFGDLANLKTWKGTPAIKEILPTDEARFLFRARVAYSEAEVRDMLINPVKRLGPPPWRLARAGRMNAAGISVFYGALEPDTCVAEARAPVGSYVVVGRFEIIKGIRVLDLDVLRQVATLTSWFDPEFTTLSNRAAFLRHLAEEISRPIMPRDEEFEYLPTQAVSEYLASSVEPPLDGTIFHSAQTANEGRNIVLFHRAAGVEPYTLPEGTKVNVNMGWASDDDYDDSITVWEETAPMPEPKPEEKTPSGKEIPNFAAILERASQDEPADRQEEEVFYGEPTLRLDVQKIEVFRIKAVTFDKSRRSISRYRHEAVRKEPF